MVNNMKQNEYIISAFIYSLLTIFTSFISILNIPGICTTYTLLDKGTTLSNDHSIITILTKIAFIISIILTCYFTFIYLT